MTLLNDYASGGGVVDSGLISRVESHIERLERRFAAFAAESKGQRQRADAGASMNQFLREQLAAAETRCAQLQATYENNSESLLNEICEHTETMQKLSQAEALLREACIGYENAHDYSRDKRLRLVPVFVAWYERAKGVIDECGTR
jgi:DNA repair exonuclease SbcCD ATPase subunit